MQTVHFSGAFIHQFVSFHCFYSVFVMCAPVSHLAKRSMVKAESVLALVAVKTKFFPLIIIQLQVYQVHVRPKPFFFLLAVASIVHSLRWVQEELFGCSAWLLVQTTTRIMYLQPTAWIALCESALAAYWCYSHVHLTYITLIYMD